MKMSAGIVGSADMMRGVMKSSQLSSFKGARLIKIRDIADTKNWNMLGGEHTG